MRYVHPIVSSSRCVGRLGISDKENDRLSTALIELDAVECRKQRQWVSRLPEYSVRPRVRQFE
jgi:hypothetical protein